MMSTICQEIEFIKKKREREKMARTQKLTDEEIQLMYEDIQHAPKQHKAYIAKDLSFLPPAKFVLS